MNTGIFKEVSRPPEYRFLECPLAKNLDVKKCDFSPKDYDVSLVKVLEYMKNCPIENGYWEGERGNSKWIPDSGYEPQKSNPEGKTWKEILEKYGTDGIVFKDGEPDFSIFSRGNVTIEGFTTRREDNFDKADIALANQRGCSPDEVARWRKENKYTWHECRDMETMQKVVQNVHNNVPHRGGVSEAKKGIGEQA